MPAAILLVAGFIVLQTERTLFPVRNHRNLLRTDPRLYKILPCTLGPFFSEYYVIVSRATFITMTLDFQNGTGMFLKPLRIMVQHFHS